MGKEKEVDDLLAQTLTNNGENEMHRYSIKENDRQRRSNKIPLCLRRNGIKGSSASNFLQVNVFFSSAEARDRKLLDRINAS